MAESSEDVVKNCLAIPKWLTRSAYLAPDIKGSLKNVWIIIITILCTSFEISQIIYLMESDKLEDILSRIPVLSLNLQPIYKGLVLYFYGETLNDIVTTIETKFWRSNLIKSTQKSIENEAKLLSIFMKVYYVIGGTYLTMISVNCIANLDSIRELVLRSRFPFEWKTSPTFEILLALQLFVEFLFLLPVIIGADCYFLVICHNINCQYEILKEMVGYLGNTSTSSKFLELLNKEGSGTGATKGNRNREFLILCMRHHSLLLETSKKLERVYNLPNMIQLFSSVFGLCFAAFVILNSSDGKILVIATTVYSCGHFVELFSICMMGNDLSSKAGQLSQSIFNSNWYETYDKDLRKDLVIFLRRLGDAPVLTAYKIWALNYETCISVLKLTFSCFTFLSKINAKSKNASTI